MLGKLAISAKIEVKVPEKSFLAIEDKRKLPLTNDAKPGSGAELGTSPQTHVFQRLKSTNKTEHRFYQ